MGRSKTANGLYCTLIFKRGVSGITHTGFSHIDNAERNRNVILNVIRDTGPLSRKDISDTSNLSVTTVKRLVEELLTDGIITETKEKQETIKRGRKAQTLTLDSEYGYTIGVNIEPHLVHISALDLTGNTLLEKTHYLEDVSRTTITETMFESTQTVIDELTGEGRKNLLGIGVGIAGLIDSVQGTVLYCPNLPGWENVPLGDMVQEKTGTGVIIDDGVRCMVLAEKRYGKEKSEGSMLLVYFGRGVGAGIILENRLYRGSNGIAGEFGHITIKESGPLCNCGNRGCLEALTSRQAILSEVNEKIKANVYTSLKNLPAFRADENGITLTDIADAAANGDKLSNMVIHEVGGYIGTGIADLINVLDPGLVILSGDVIHSFGPPLLESINRTVTLRGIHSITQRTRIAASSLPGSSASRGAATLVLERFFENSILNLP